MVCSISDFEVEPLTIGEGVVVESASQNECVFIVFEGEVEISWLDTIVKLELASVEEFIVVVDDTFIFIVGLEVFLGANGSQYNLRVALCFLYFLIGEDIQVDDIVPLPKKNIDV